jgi:hypothetical protein
MDAWMGRAIPFHHSLVSTLFYACLEVRVILQCVESQTGSDEPEPNPRHDQEHQSTDCQLCTCTGHNASVCVSTTR